MAECKIESYLVSEYGPESVKDKHKIDCLLQQTIKNWILLSQKISLAAHL